MFVLGLISLSSTDQNSPIFFLCYVMIMTPVKSQLCLVGFAAEVKEGFRGDIAALYFTLSKVIDAYLAVEVAQ